MTNQGKPSVLVFGANGSIGTEIVRAFKRDGYSVTAMIRHPSEIREADIEVVLRGSLQSTLGTLSDPNFDAVVWAQGMNANDSVLDVEPESFDRIMAANLGFVVESMSDLVSNGRLARPARLCILSSIWEQISRTQKFSYTVSKAALGGLVRAASADLASKEIYVNAVLPGVVDTSMTRGVLTPEQIESVSQTTGFGRLTSTKDVAEAVLFLCSSRNGAITGQSLKVDLGFSHVRKI